MTVYNPDLWVIVELKYNDSDEVNRKVLASWYGGYLGSDRWKLSSGITEIVDKDLYYEIHNHSGSIYNCGKQSQGMSGYTSGIFTSFEKDLEGVGTIKIINYGEHEDGISGSN
ncbi:hypothetical protein UFOVP190_19 [uncultured Caudovirales phage]|uniref:Uncharacterized protein n=1 Tax=uncultured Caudovirales phage TaxID=2100421 RepID=A0A6J7WGV3_9CAUD|nr:hypothetical protein UFOVP190_19 [uncultured Caudovirales phage]